MNMNELVPGDVLLYGSAGLYGTIIGLKTWHHIAHVEVYAGNGMSEASRDGVGVGRYPYRSEGLAYVLRPTSSTFDWQAGEAWFEQVKGQPYGWVDLLQFAGLPIDGPGMVCSPFATARLRASRLPIFNDEPAVRVAPFEFVLSELLVVVYRSPEQELSPMKKYLQTLAAAAAAGAVTGVTHSLATGVYDPKATGAVAIAGALVGAGGYVMQSPFAKKIVDAVAAQVATQKS